jgi:hypothetical protein
MVHPHTIQWLRDRQYLPRPGQDFKVAPFPIEAGAWKAEWYGITAPNS